MCQNKQMVILHNAVFSAHHTVSFRVTVSALLSLVGPAHQLFYHLLHLNVMCFEQIKFDLI